MVHDKNRLTLYISPGKHGRIHREKTLDAGKPFPVAMVFGQHPLMFIAATQSVPIGVNEYEWAGGIVGEPVQLIEGPLTGLRIPAAAEIAIEGEIIPGETLPEGPFGEWTGYYASARRAEPVVNVKAVYHRQDPIITGAPPFKPTIHGSYRSLLRGAMIWNAMEQAGVPDIRGVYLPPPAQRFMIVVAIKQRYPGHAKQAAIVAGQCQPGAYLGRYVVVVDDDVDVTNLDEVVWAMATRSDPASSLDIIRRAWSGPLDPILPTERKGHNSRAIIDATRPYEWRDRFPAISQINDEKRREVTARWEKEILRIESQHQKATRGL
jgi:4-hydroxy-3-polyprenylbenzoate decarboxylase